MAAFGEIRDPLVGTRIDDRYLVNGVLGRGGMGVVYEGIHEQLGRPVAIKVLGAGIAGDPTAVQRFLREARTASQLTHGNIVDVSDLGQLPDGRPYLVMARMQGMDLCTMLQTKGPQSPQRTVELLRGAAAALDLIHAKGYVHRDVKPENLMHVVREDGSEAVLVLDFGIVGLVSAQSARLTAEGSVFGTPAYLPPELIQGDNPDGRADTYSLATVAFELITGRTPFVASTPLQLLPMKVMEDAPRMGDVTGVHFPEALEQAMAKSLARDPKLRHATTGAFIADLEAATKLYPMGALSKSPDANGGGLDSAARERLRSTSTDDFEMPIGFSGPPSSMSVGDTQKLQSEPALSTFPTSRLSVQRKRRNIIAGLVAGAVLLAGVIAVVMNSGTANKPPAPAELAKPSDVFTPKAPAVLPSEPPVADPPPPTAVEHAARTLPPPTAAAPHAAAHVPKHAASSPSAAPVSPAQPKVTPAAVVAVVARGPSATELGQSAQRELIQGHLAAAADLYAQATRVDPRNESAWRGLGLASERLGRTAEAVRALKRAIQLAPNGQNANMLRARLQKLATQ